ncbi:MAG TPA: BglII/BstYI family type II restriction endonuclease [Blastocatellia bacterium]|nr:BglII/BstYI family type II restriction endonuclease [Blastocatellia bacterium]
MKIVGVYSFKNGKKEVTKRHPTLLTEVNAVIKSVDASAHKVKVSKEKTMPGRMLYSPPSINKAFKREFSARGWGSIRVSCDYPTTFYVRKYKIRSKNKGAFREMDFVKEKLGIEVQFGKYAFITSARR